MDTCSGKNFMSRALVTELGLNENDRQQSEVTLRFTAGVKKTAFTQQFEILEDCEVDMLLGEPTLCDTHLMTDPDYKIKPEHEVVGRIPDAHILSSLHQRVYLPKPCMTISLRLS